MMSSPAPAARRRLSSARATASSSRVARCACRRAICSASAEGSIVRKPSAPAASGDCAVSVKQLTPTTGCVPAAIAASRRPFDPPAAASCSRSRQRRARRPSPQCGQAPHALRRPAPRPWPPPPAPRRTGRRTRADRSRRPGSAAAAGSTAGPRAAAGRAPRSRPAAAPPERAPASTAPRRAPRAECDRRCFRLLLRQAERVDLHAITEAAQVRIGDAIALRRDLIPQFGEGAQLAHLGDEAHAGVDEEADAPDHAGIPQAPPDRPAHLIEHRDRRGERVGELLDRRRPASWR